MRQPASPGRVGASCRIDPRDLGMVGVLLLLAESEALGLWLRPSLAKGSPAVSMSPCPVVCSLCLVCMLTPGI